MQITDGGIARAEGEADAADAGDRGRAEEPAAKLHRVAAQRPRGEERRRVAVCSPARGVDVAAEPRPELAVAAERRRKRKRETEYSAERATTSGEGGGIEEADVVYTSRKALLRALIDDGRRRR